MRKHINTLTSALLVTALMVTLSIGYSFLQKHPIGFTLGEGGNIFLPIVESDASAADPAVEQIDEPDVPEPEVVVPNENDEQKVIRILAAEADKARHLASYPGWIAQAWDQEDGTWYVEFKSDESDDAEWLGDGTVNVATGEIVHSFTPVELTTEAYQAGLAQIEAFLEYDAEIRARMGNPDLWEKYVDWDRWEQQWYASYYYGLEEFVVIFTFWDDKPVVAQITDPNKLEEKKQAEWDRNQAVELTFEIDGIWDVLDGVDDWVTYVEPQGENQWSVEIVAAGEEKFHALVNIDTWTVIESGE